MWYHIVSTQTWRTDEFCVPGCHGSPSAKHIRKKIGRSSESIALGFKLALKPGIMMSNPHFIWAKPDKTFFNLDQDIFPTKPAAKKKL